MMITMIYKDIEDLLETRKIKGKKGDLLSVLNCLKNSDCYKNSLENLLKRLGAFQKIRVYLDMVEDRDDVIVLPSLDCDLGNGYRIRIILPEEIQAIIYNNISKTFFAVFLEHSELKLEYFNGIFYLEERKNGSIIHFLFKDEMIKRRDIYI